MQNVLEKIEKSFSERKDAAKSYATPVNASKAALKEIERFQKAHDTTIRVEYLVFFVPSIERYTVIFNLTKFMQEYQNGLFLGWFAQRGFYSI